MVEVLMVEVLMVEVLMVEVLMVQWRVYGTKSSSSVGRGPSTDRDFLNKTSRKLSEDVLTLTKSWISNQKVSLFFFFFLLLVFISSSAVQLKCSVLFRREVLMASPVPISSSVNGVQGVV